MSKYEPLTAFLSTARTEEVRMSFGDIERVIGTSLPPSKQYAAWWSNNSSNNVMTKAWLKAGFRTERVDPVGERLVFRRVRAAAAGSPIKAGGAQAKTVSFVEEFQARFAGQITVRPGVDLTAPTGETWDAEQD